MRAACRVISREYRQVYITFFQPKPYYVLRVLSSLYPELTMGLPPCGCGAPPLPVSWATTLTIFQQTVHNLKPRMLNI